MGGLMRVDKCDVAHSEATEHGREIAFSEGLQAFRRLGTAGYHDVNLLPRDQANMAVMIVAEGSTRKIHIERTSVVAGKRVSVRVDPGGRCIIKNIKKNKTSKHRNA